MSSDPIQDYAILDEVKLKLNISITDSSQDAQITVATNDSNNYIAEQTVVHATVVVAGNDPSLSSMANNLAAAYFNFWLSTEKDKEEIERWQNRIQQYIMAKYGKKSANLLSGEETIGVTSGFVSPSAGTSTSTSTSPLTTKGDIYGFSLFDARIPVGDDGLILTANSSDGLGVSWEVAGGGTGDVVGPSGATDNAIARYNLTSGKIIQDSSVLIDDSNNVTGVGTLNSHTIPGGTDAFVMLDVTQTLTNKSIDASNNTISNIAVADLADGTTGELISWDASDVPTVIDAGEINQVLTSTGGITPPVFATPLAPPSGSLDDLTDVTLTSPATNDLLVKTASDWVNANGVFVGITGLGGQSQALNMNSNNISSVGTINNNTISVTSDTFAMIGAAQTLTNKTLTTPTITSFENAGHDHSNTAGGGNLTNSALASGVFSNITGIGTQSQALDMNTNNIANAVLVTPTIASFENAGHDHSNTAGGAQLTNTALASGTFASITGIGLQSQTLNMNTNSITNAVLITPTIASFLNAGHNHEAAAGGGQLLSTSALSDTDDIAYLNTANLYTAGAKQSFVADTNTAAINLNAFVPGTTAAGDIYRSAEIMRFTGTSLTDYLLVSDGQSTTYISGLQNFSAVTLRIPVSATPSVTVDGDFAYDTTVTDFSTGLIKFFGTEEQGIVAMPIGQFASPVDGNVITYNETNDEFELISPPQPETVHTTCYNTQNHFDDDFMAFATIAGPSNTFLDRASKVGYTTAILENMCITTSTTSVVDEITTLTLYVNNIITALTIEIPANSDPGTFLDNGQQIAVTTDDTYALRMSNIGGATYVSASIIERKTIL